MITATEKKEIALKLKVYVDGFSSQKKAAESLADCSEATVINILKNEPAAWAQVSEAMWLNVQAQVTNTVDYSKLVETQNFQTLMLYFGIAADEGASFALIGRAGWGKSYAAKWYAATNRRETVIYLECAEWWNKRIFLSKILSQLGKSGAGLSIGEQVEMIIRELRRHPKSLIIMDEVDKLPDPVLKLYITIYNAVNGRTGFMWLSTDAIDKRFEIGLSKNTIGYAELYSRIGANFIPLTQPTQDEIVEICKRNGITNDTAIAQVVNNVKDLRGDLRRVDRKLLQDKIKIQMKRRA